MDKMMPIMMENDTLRKMMPQMMTAMMPHCFRNMLQHLPAEEKASFISEIESLLADVKSGDS
ncbi:MAG: hypothetical protein GY950_23060 [bacterium]|nr:hypothetical protein [bacterium]